MTDQADEGEEQYMSTDTEAAEAMYQLSIQCPEATSALQTAIREVLVPAMATQPGEEEDQHKYFYDSNDSVVDLDAQGPELTQRFEQRQISLDDDAAVPLGVPPASVDRNGSPSMGRPTCARCWTR